MLKPKSLIDFWGNVRARPQIRVYGARGVVLLCLAVLCFSFGISYVGPMASPIVTEGLRPLDAILPLPYWGVLWFVGAFHVAASAFRVDQSKALGVVAGMFIAWGYSHVVASILAFVAGNANRMWLSAVIFFVFAALVMGIAALLNPATAHPKVEMKPGPDPAGGDSA